MHTTDLTGRPNLAGRRALITGASSGFGEHWGKLLASSGAQVALAARRKEKLDALANAIGEAALPVAMDVASEASIIAGYDEAEAAFGTLDTIIVNAGVDGAGMAHEMPAEEIAQTLAINLQGAILTAREGAKRMMAAGVTKGRIVMIASITAFEASPGLVAYSASKAGVVQATRSLAREWARRGISINSISPGYVRTAINDEWFETEAGKKQIARWPRKRLMAMEGMDDILLFLASDAAEYVTGTDFVLDDGQTL
jgi:NAD(P)-dependent dehydrogenase (short-subunit alcohol dehydrogenase family)